MGMHTIPTKVRDSDCGFTRREIKRFVHRHERRAAVREIEAQRHPDAQVCSCDKPCYDCESPFGFEPPTPELGFETQLDVFEAMRGLRERATRFVLGDRW
jgi:hypothetical protein